MNAIRRFFIDQSVPREHRTNFFNLYLEVAWWGVVSGTAVNFLTVYATRIGGSGFQIGILASIAALVNLLLALPASRIVEAHSIHDTAFWCSLLYRLGYFFWIPLPLLFGSQTQIWLLILITFISGFPLTVQSVSFTSLFANTVPPEWRASVASIRNLCYSATYMLTVFGAGWLLAHLPFPFNYQLIFGIGSIASMIGCIHIYFIRPHGPAAPANTPTPPLPVEQKTAAAPAGDSPKLRLNILRTHYGWVLLALLGLNLTINLPGPLFPLFQVNVLHLNDQSIGLGTAFFYLTSIIGSTQVNRSVSKLGHRKVAGLGLVVLALYPFLLAVIHSALGFYLASIIGGFAWALINSTSMNYALESIPANEQPVYLAWYTIVTNFSVLAGSLLGPAIASLVGLTPALYFSGVLRLGVGYVIFVGLTKGKPKLETRKGNNLLQSKAC